MPLEIHLVTHTHWDREWYQPVEIFRQRLADLVDELIDDPPGDAESFLLDGQAIVLEDYLEVRPDRLDQLAALLRDGRLEAGPWYVLADELIPSGEALVRNLLLGRWILDRLGAAAPPVLYCPDSFGHPAMLPEISAGFGLSLIVLWRGYGGTRWPRGDVVRWRAPSGTDALVFHLPPDGYEFGASLPLDPEQARSRWERIRGILAPRSTVGVTLLQNGADHHSRQNGRDVAFKLIRSLADKTHDRVRASSLRSFAASLVKRASAQRVPTIKGELRDSYGYTWTLQGTLATRAAQKRSNAAAERSLIRGAEPWSALAWFNGGTARHPQIRSAWKTLLQGHPHDTLCGTSIDEVAAAMDQRLWAARTQAVAIMNDSVRALLGDSVAVASETHGDWKSVVIVRNDSPRPVGGVVIVELIEKLADEPVGPGSQRGPRIDVIAKEVEIKVRPPDGMQLLASRIGRERIESPRHYPDNDIVRVTTLVAITGPLPPMSLTVLPSIGTSLPAPGSRVRASAQELTNAIVTCRFGKRGLLSVEAAGRSLGNVVRIEDRMDRGDLYTPSVGAEAATAQFVKHSISHRGPLLGEVRHGWKLVAGSKKGPPPTGLEISYRMTAGSPLIEVIVSGENAATNHRLRLGIATGISGAKVVADAAFGPIERVPIETTPEEAKVERPPATAPLHRYVSLFSAQSGATVHSDGLAEYEVDGKGVVWITLLRAVGDLSRNDLRERPGHAGWPVDTPDAQSIGPFGARLALHLHEARTPTTIDEIERESDRFLNPLRGTTLRSMLRVPTQFVGPELAGIGLAFSAIKQSDDGNWLVLRCVNLLDREQAGRWTLPRAIQEAQLARLDETPLRGITVTPGQSVIEFMAAPRGVVTILVR